MDQMGEQFHFKSPPCRIISLVPSITEYLYDLGLGGSIVGCTKFCIHPQGGLGGVPKIGGTKQFDIDKIKSLKPDLIIGNKEENYLEGIKKLKENFMVWMTDILSLQDNYDMMRDLGAITGKMLGADFWIQRVKDNLLKYQKIRSTRVLYLIWRNPYMAVGKGTFINSILEYLGYENVILQLRYPEMDEIVLKQLQVDQVMLSSEPFPFKEKHKDEIASLLPEAEIQLVNGEAFSWYGSRLAKVDYNY